MKTHSVRLREIVILVLACWLGNSKAAGAGTLPLQPQVVPGERLSDWLVRNAVPGTDTTALHWRVAAEQAPQERLRQAVVQTLGEHEPLAAWLRALPLTGRLTVARADARWLQAVPAQDPVLQEGHSVVLLPRPGKVTVLTEEGQTCTVAHAPGALIGDYLQSCWGANGRADRDWAWLAQPDGRTHQYGIGSWSQTEQDTPGPGAWIWAPRRQAGIARHVSDNLIRILATQLPSDHMPALGAMPVQPVAPVLTAASATPRNSQTTASDWGEIGLMQTPSARMEQAGAVRMHLGRTEPYTRVTVMFQPLDWLEAGFRYVDISNRLYGPQIAGDQTYKDKSIDFKIRLREEDKAWPQIALGVRDVGGTGLFAGEYLVANKRWGNWDASVGLGWGYLGARGSIKGPLSLLDNAFDTREGNNNASGGTANAQSLFRGPAAPFGGVQWHSPSDQWVFKLELDGNDYQHEPLGNNQTTTTPFNVGAVYRYSPYIDMSVGLERGNRAMFGITLHGALNQLEAPKLLDPALPAVRTSAAWRPPPIGWTGTAQSVELHTGWKVQGISQQLNTTTIQLEADGAAHLQDRIDRAVTILDRDTPPSSQKFVLQLRQRGLALSQVEIDRAEWVALRTQAQAPALRLPVQKVVPGQQAVETEEVRSSAGFSADWSPSYSQILGGPDNFLLYQLGMQAKVEQRFSDRTWLTGNFNVRVLDNYQNFVYDAPSDLPRVRTHQREYVTTSRTTMPLLQLTHVQELGSGHYASAYGGMLEPMFGGVGGEWLYRPWQSRFAFGVDANRVQQRGFQQNLEFRDYTVNTGHATLYWDTGWNDLQVNLSAGQYLAGDAGATLDVKRVFSNGVAVGAWATKTNVSAEQFGEGSFDKGIYVRIPFDVLSPRSSAGSGNIVWNPLTRDGGARLSRSFALYDLTQQRDRRAWQWKSPAKSGPSTAEHQSFVLGDSGGHPLADARTTTVTLGQQIANVPASTWLWAGGAILASSLLDKEVDQRTVDSTGGSSTALGGSTNAVPYAMALGAGLLYTGIASESAAATAGTALSAAAYTLGANLATRYVVGRSRPYEEMGPSNFNGVNSAAVRSGFASSHVAIAFALATPFAQQYDMPWLYAAAASTAIGRIQSREHWLSDTVAGAFIGYTMGSMLSEQQLGRKRAVRVNVTPQSVEATWSF